MPRLGWGTAWGPDVRLPDSSSSEESGDQGFLGLSQKYCMKPSTNAMWFEGK